MNKIIFPLKSQMKSSEVGDLHQALIALGFEIAAKEQKELRFGAATRKSVLAFQEKHGLEPSGVVDQKTAARINRELKGRERPPASDFVVKGRVMTADDSLAGALVRAVDQDQRGENPLGDAITDQDGNYQIIYSESQFRRTEKEIGGPDLIVRVYSAEGNLMAQSKRKRNAGREETVNLTVVSSEQPFVVSGTVRRGDGRPAAGVIVRAYDQDLRKKQLLGKATTDASGHYSIAYTSGKFLRAEKASADLRVVVMDSKGKELVSSELLFNTQSEADVDLTLPLDEQTLSEFELLLNDILPLLAGQGTGGVDLKINELAEKDIAFLSQETGQPQERIALLLAAVKASLATSFLYGTLNESHIKKSNHPAIPVEAFYGWFRQNLPTDWEALRLLRINILRKALLDAIDQKIIPGKLHEDIESILARIPNPQIRELATVLEWAALSQKKVRAVLTQVDTVEAVSDAVLAELVEQKALAQQEAELVGLNVSLHRLAGGEQTLVSTMLDSKFASVNTGKLQQARDLALLEPEDWESALDNTASSVPEGMPRAEYARSLAMEAVSAFPHAAFVQRATRIPAGIDDKLNKIQPLLEKNEKAIALDFDALDLAGVSDTDRAELQEAHTNLKRFANLHPGLGLHEVFSKQDGAGNTVELVGERIGWLSTVFELNPEVSFLDLDYLPDSADLKEVKFGALSEEARDRVLQDLKAHQRINTVTNNAIPARQIMEAGFHSASVIALARASDFSEKTGLPEAEARAYHAAAQEVANEAASQWLKIYDVARDQATASFRVIPSTAEFFKPLRGFVDLINNQPWCACAHCQSVLSPAAYFVDLMYYIEQNILIDSFKGRATHPLHLQVRRPDLWELDLTCKNTNEYVPYLEVVNEILERYIKNILPAVSAGDIYKHLADQEGSFQQPFTLPIERLEILLEHFGLSRYEVAKTMGSDREIQARARLKISKKEYDLITIAHTSVGDLPFFKRLFKITYAISISSADTVLDPMEMQMFLHATSLAHEIVESVLKSTFVNADGSTNTKIEVILGKRAPEDLQNNSELVKHITLRRLDRIHRFVRLWRKLPWTIEELDYVLTQLASPDEVSRIDAGTPAAAGVTGKAGTLERILDLLDLNAEWSLPVDELMALSDVFPPKGLREAMPLFDRLFNQPPFLDRDGRWPPLLAIPFIHPAWKRTNIPLGVSDPNNNTLTRLLAGMQVEDKELVKLIESLAAIPAIGYQSATPTADESISLTKESIGILYRHARLMRLLKSTVTDFVKLIELTPRIGARLSAEKYIRDLDDVKSIIEFAAWQRSSGFSLDEIIYVTGGARPEVVLDPAKLASEIVARVRTEKSLEFEDTVFTQIGLTVIQSRKIVSDNLSQNATNNIAFEVLPDGASYRLKVGFDPSANVVWIDPPIDPPVDGKLVTNLLKKYYTMHVLDVALGSALDLSPEETKQLRELAHPLVTADVTAISLTMQDGQDKARLTELLADMLRYRALFKIASEIVATVKAEKSLEFADTVFTQIGLTDLQSRQIVLDNVSKTPLDNKAFEILSDGVSYRLKAGFGVGTGLISINPPGSPPIDVDLIRGLLSKYDAVHILNAALGSPINRSAEEIEEIRALANPLLVDTLQVSLEMQGLLGISHLHQVVTDTLRYGVLFKSKVFDVKSLGFVRNNSPVFFPLKGSISTQVVRNVAAYIALATAIDPGFTTASDPADIDALHAVLEATGIESAREEDLAKTLHTDKTRIGALKPHLITFPSNPFDALGVLARCLVFTEQMGVSGETLSLMIKEESAPATFDRLSRAAEDVFGAFRAKYPQEKTFQEKMEPFEDKLRTRKRDGLVDFVVSKWPEPFADANKLYEYFLIDVLLEGCARTSRVVAAISSLQLYVHRVRMNLEWSKDWTPNVDGSIPAKSGVYAHFTDTDKQAEWYWRENYRVWEANRKVFLYPENYIEPELRDDKTPLFKELEDTLLQQEISDSNVHDAYAKYLTGFDEVARLKIAGTYYDGGADVLHLFGVTQDAPPVYFYRTIEKSKSQVPHISAWQKLSLQIPVRKVSPILFEERLHVFWLEITTRPHSIFEEGKSLFQGYRHNVRIKYSTLRTDGAWTPPQSLSFSNGAAIEESRIINDPLPTDAAKEEAALKTQIDDLKKGIIDLEENEKKARDEVTRTNTVVVSRQGEMTAVSSQDDDVQAVAEAVAASLAAFSAAAFAAFAGPPAQAAAFALAWWGILAGWVQKPVSELVAAGVNMTDAPHMARRKHALWLAKFIAGIAADALKTVTEALKKVRADLVKLEEALAKLNFAVRWDKSRRDHSEPLDNYKPEGWEWDRVYPDVYSPLIAPTAKRIRLMLVPRNDPAVHLPDEVDLTSGLLRQIPLEYDPYEVRDSLKRLGNNNGSIYLIDVREIISEMQDFCFASMWLNDPSNSCANRWLCFASSWRDSSLQTAIALAPATSDMQAVNGATASIIIESQGYPVWMRKVGAASYLGTRLGTTLTATLAKEFGRQGASTLLEAGFQKKLTELPPKISPISGQSHLEMQNPFHPTNPYLTYYRETFFHIPFLVANHLNSQQKFAETQRWYHHIFNPTAADGLAWRYREFRDPIRTSRSLREMLTDKEALAAYRKDPFNPHAIARTRLSAYQKSIVMKYIDNLLDWGDSLFSQFTMESVNEAAMLYVMAQDILGPRPPMLGSCGEGKVSPKNYQTIRPGLKEISDFLIELESPTRAFGFVPTKLEGVKFVIKTRQASTYASTIAGGLLPPSGGPITIGPVGAAPSTIKTLPAAADFNQTGVKYWTNVGGTSLKDLYDMPAGVGNDTPTILGTESGTPRIPGNKTGNIDFINPDSGFAGGEFGVPGGDKIKQLDQIPPLDLKYGRRDYFDIEHPQGVIIPDKELPPAKFNPVEVVPPKYSVFCIPPNKDLLAYWGRVEDRLFKIRNCMDIAGVRRNLELFAPEIDPRFLVRMKAAGLTLDDVLNAVSGNLPPYRFTYLIEKARQYAGTLQSFGSQLLSAIEKRDGEELAQVRAVHEQNLLKMRSRMIQLEIDAAEDAIEGLRRQKAAAEYRQGYFHSLSDVGSIASERKQQQHQREASNFRTQASAAQFIAAILSIIPDAGAPTAMKFGGSQLGAAGRAAADGLNALSAFNEMSASMAGMEASNQRRDQEWKHQIQTAKRDISQIEKQITAAEIRRDITIHSLEVHEKTVDQSEEVFDFFRDKFSSFGRYTLLSNRLHRLYRLAFNSALSMAKMTEQAYRAERTDDNTLLDGNYWDADNAGLLAGERLLIDLQALERQYIEKNYRQLEIEQSFSLAQFAPDELATLRLTGECKFKIPEWFFDLTYPGQYRRRLKSARLTIPCVTGPYTNVGATLRLESSQIRLIVPQPLPPLAQLPEPTSVPLRHTVKIASSKAQYDAGVFDFSFRDERYMPFEGAGAISTWELSLPKTLRAFDYGTISDVILHLSYTAEFNVGLKDTWESQANGLIDLLTIKNTDPVTKEPPMTRSFSLRQEFPDVFHRLLTSPLDTAIGFTIEPRHFPFFLIGRALKAKAGNAKLQVISPLNSLVGTAGSVGTTIPRTTLAIGQKATTQLFRDLAAPAQPIQQFTGKGMREFDFGDVLQSSSDLKGIPSTLIGDYVIKLKVAGPLAPGGGAIDPLNLHDIILEIGYGLA